MLRTKQESARWMAQLVTNFSGSEGLAVKFCEGTITEVRACLLLPEHRLFVRCEKDECYVREVLPSSLKAHEQHVPCAESYFTVNEDICVAVPVLVREIDGIQAQGKDETWKVPIALSAVQSYPRHVIHCIAW